MANDHGKLTHLELEAQKRSELLRTVFTAQVANFPKLIKILEKCQTPLESLQKVILDLKALEIISNTLKDAKEWQIDLLLDFKQRLDMAIQNLEALKNAKKASNFATQDLINNFIRVSDSILTYSVQQINNYLTYHGIYEVLFAVDQMARQDKDAGNKEYYDELIKRLKHYLSQVRSTSIEKQRKALKDTTQYLNQMPSHLRGRMAMIQEELKEINHKYDVLLGHAVPPSSSYPENTTRRSWEVLHQVTRVSNRTKAIEALAENHDGRIVATFDQSFTPTMGRAGGWCYGYTRNWAMDFNALTAQKLTLAKKMEATIDSCMNFRSDAGKLQAEQYLDKFDSSTKKDLKTFIEKELDSLLGHEEMTTLEVALTSSKKGGHALGLAKDKNGIWLYDSNNLLILFKDDPKDKQKALAQFKAFFTAYMSHSPLYETFTQINYRQLEKQRLAWRHKGPDTKKHSATPMFGAQQRHARGAQKNQEVIKRLEARLTGIQNEPPMLRKGHEERLFAMNKIIAHIRNHPVYQQGDQFIDLNNIERIIQKELSPEALKKFNKGLRSSSSVAGKKDDLSIYQIMKNNIRDYIQGRVGNLLSDPETLQLRLKARKPAPTSKK